MTTNAANVIQYEPRNEVIPQTPMAMLQVAVAKGMSAETIKGFMDLQERWEKAEAVKAYNVAFAAFKTEAVSIFRNRKVTQGPLAGKSYAELHSVVDAVTPALSKHGLSASWKLTKDDKDWLEVTCTLKHILGHSESVSMGGPPDDGGAKSKIQARASTMTFLERYTLKAVCGVSEQGDDNNGGRPKADEPDAAGKAALEKCGSLASLQETWKALSPAQRKTLVAVKDECRTRIEEADAEAAK
jgi:hypothetical protein